MDKYWLRAVNADQIKGYPQPYKQQNENRLHVFDLFKNDDLQDL